MNLNLSAVLCRISGTSYIQANWPSKRSRRRGADCKGPAVPTPRFDPSKPVDDRDAAAMLAAIVESSDDAIVSKSLQGVISTWNKGAERLFGYAADEVIGKSITILIPEDRLEEEPAILARIQAGERVDHFETVRRRKDGHLLDISLTISPIRSASGEIVGASKIARDVSEKKRAAETQALLLREMQHRIKNLFAITGGLVGLAARDADTPKALADSLKERLAALSRAHELTLPGTDDQPLSGAPATLFKLVDSLLRPYQRQGHTRLDFVGRDITIPSHQLTSIALLLHEFVTNSAKYGALSAPDGRVQLETKDHADAVRITWSEIGGPAVNAPTGYAGFGSRLEGSIRESLQATIDRDWRADGLVIRMTLPLGVLTE